MNIQIFGKSKCFDTKKAERYFKERRVKYQYIDMKKYGISRGELNGVLRSVPLSDLVDPKHPDAALLQYLAYDQDKVEKVLENPTLLRTPIGPQRKTGHGGLPAGAVENLGMTKSLPFLGHHLLSLLQN